MAIWTSPHFGAHPVPSIWTDCAAACAEWLERSPALTEGKSCWSYAVTAVHIQLSAISELGYIEVQPWESLERRKSRRPAAFASRDSCLVQNLTSQRFPSAGNVPDLS